MTIFPIDSQRLGENEWSLLVLLRCCRPIYSDTDQNVWRGKKSKKQWTPDPTMILGHYMIIISFTCIYLSSNDCMYLTAGWRRGTRSPFPLYLPCCWIHLEKEALLSTGRSHWNRVVLFPFSFPFFSLSQLSSCLYSWSVHEFTASEHCYLRYTRRTIVQSIYIPIIYKPASPQYALCSCLLYRGRCSGRHFHRHRS